MARLVTSGTIAVESCSFDVTISSRRRRHDARVFTEKVVNVSMNCVSAAVLITHSALVVSRSVLEILVPGFVNLHFVALIVIVEMSC